MRKRGDNVGVPAASAIAVPLDVEFAVYDALGPRVREALRDMPVKFSAFPIGKAFHERGIDPLDPKVDDGVASQLRAHSYHIIATDRGEADAAAAIRPLQRRASL